MKERPILFSAPMVRALLDGSKTQTRRAVKLPHKNPLGVWEPFDWGGENGGCDKHGNTAPAQQTIAHTRTGDIIACPYGQPGDRLWVRETWNSSGLNWRKPIRDMRKVLGPVHYSADPEHGGWMPYWGPMKPSIHMPRWASRITLEITRVRVERLQDISEADAMAEGIERQEDGLGWKRGPISGDHPNTATRTAFPRLAYHSLWESINGPDSWATNPWVWAIEFKRIKQEAA